MGRMWPWRVIAAGLVVTAVVGGTSLTLAAKQEQPPRTYTAGDKLLRGLANVFTGFIEIPRNIHNTTEEESLLAGWTVGLGKGIGSMALRMFVGVYEVLSFPFPAPKDYVPVLEPAYVWQASGPRYK